MRERSRNQAKAQKKSEALPGASPSCRSSEVAHGHLAHVWGLRTTGGTPVPLSESFAATLSCGAAASRAVAERRDGVATLRGRDHAAASQSRRSRARWRARAPARPALSAG